MTDSPDVNSAPSQPSAAANSNSATTPTTTTTTTTANNNKQNPVTNGYGAPTATTAGNPPAHHNNNNNNNNNTTTTTTNSSSTNNNDGHRTPNADHLSKTNLYIRGLQSNTVDQDLYNMCARFGQISSTKAILDKSTGCCKGYGFVEFTSPDTADLALQELTKSGVQAQMAKVTSLYSSNHHHHHHHHHHSATNNQHHPHHHQHQHQSQHHHHHQQQQQQQQQSVQHQQSPQQSHQAQHHSQNNHQPGSSNNSGSPNNNQSESTRFANNSTANGSFSNNSSNNNQTHNNNSSSSSNNNSSHPDPTNLYIANLPPNMSEQELENLLSTYGPVVSTRILRDQSNIPRGVGFARMESRDKCEQIIEQLNGRPCKGWKEPLLVKFADGGNKKRHHHNNHHQHHNSSHHHHHQRHKAHQEDTRWRESGSAVELGNVTNFEHQGNISHNEHMSDLSMISTMGYPRMPHGFPQSVPAGAAYPPPMGHPGGGHQWIHAGAAGQAYVIPQQMMQSNPLDRSNQAAVAAAAAAMHYGHIPQLASQMQGLQIAHPGGHIGGYLPPQHQWSAMWTHPIPQQAHQQPMRLPAHIQPAPPQPTTQHHRQLSPHSSPVQPQQQQLTSPQPQQLQTPPSVTDDKLQASLPM